MVSYYFKNNKIAFLPLNFYRTNYKNLYEVNLQ